MSQARPRLPGAHSPGEGLGNKRKLLGRAARGMTGGTRRTVGAPVPGSSGKASWGRRHLGCVLENVVEWLGQVRRTSHVAWGRTPRGWDCRAGAPSTGRGEALTVRQPLRTGAHQGARLLPPLASPGWVPALPRLASDRLSEFPFLFYKTAPAVVPTSLGHS